MKVSKAQMFYRELPFAVQTAKVFPLNVLPYTVLYPKKKTEKHWYITL